MSLSSLLMSLHSQSNHQGIQEALAASLVDLAPSPDRVTLRRERQEITLILPKEDLLAYCRLLRDHTPLQFKVLVDVTAVDFPQEAERFRVVYHLLSLRYGTRLRLKVHLDEVSERDSLMDLYPSADWYEREVWDLFGIWFRNHSDLRRLLTDYGFRGHPLRKDFPLTGYNEVRYDEAAKRVVRVPLSLSQEMRAFKLESPWRAFQERLPQGLS